MLSELANRLKRASATAGLAAGLACAGPANAALFQGNWDPAFGSAFPDLGWQGQATFFVPDACLAINGTVSNLNSCSNLGMKLLSAEVDFYKLSDPANPAFQETLFFNTPSSLVASMNFSNGTLTGVLGAFGYYVDSALPLAGGPNTDFRLSFLNDIAVLDFRKWGPCDDEEDEHRFTFADSGERCVINRGISDRQTPDGAPFITFRAVPEPDTSALMLLSLGVLAALTMRRRTPAAT